MKRGGQQTLPPEESEAAHPDCDSDNLGHVSHPHSPHRKGRSAMLHHALLEGELGEANGHEDLNCG